MQLKMVYTDVLSCWKKKITFASLCCGVCEPQCYTSTCAGYVSWYVLMITCPFVWKVNQQFLGNVSNLAQTSSSFTCKVLMCLEQTYQDIFVWIYSSTSYGSVFSTHIIQETHDNAIAFPLQLRTSQTQPCKHLHERLGSGSLVNHPGSMQ